MEKKEKVEKKESITLKWGSGKTSLLEKATVQPLIVQQTQKETEEKKEDTDKEDVVFQVFILGRYSCRCE